jgi:Methyltransferase domain
MRINYNEPLFWEYLNGNQINANCEILFDPDLKLKNRETVLSELVKQLKVIHVGCVDHLEIMPSKIEAGTWLHQILMKSSARCLGIDINPAGISFLKEHYQIDDLYVGNLAAERIEAIENDHWDYLLLPEVLEHISNPVSFLTSVREKYYPYIKKIIITVPNVFAYPEYKMASKNIELINTDHRYWFSPYTLLKVVNDAGFVIDGLHLTNGFWGPFPYHLKRRLVNRILSLTPFQRNYKKVRDIRFGRGLLVIARFAQ